MSVGKVMTYDEMAREFAEQWVFVIDPVVDEDMNIVRGIVGGHSHSRDAVYDEAIRTKPKKSAFLCFISPKPGTGFAF